MKKVTKGIAMGLADEIKELTMAEIKTLPGFIGAIAPIQVRENGFYAYHCTTNDKNVCIVERRTA